jgi:hypothetical protein
VPCAGAKLGERGEGGEGEEERRRGREPGFSRIDFVLGRARVIAAFY